MRPIFHRLVMAAAAALLVLPAGALAASPGDLDASFNGSGTKTLNFGLDEHAEAVAVQPDGKIVVAGTDGAGLSDFLVVRYNPDGTLDASFDGDGLQKVPFDRTELANAVAIEPNGKIVVVGSTEAGGSAADPRNFAIARLTANGALDPTFDGDGKKTIGFGGDDRAQAVAIQGNRIVVGGTSDAGTNNFELVGLTDTGGFDPTFSTDGTQSADFGGIDRLEALAVSPSGNLLAAGYTSANGTSGNEDDFALVQLDSLGNPDGGFSGDGKQTVDLGSDDQAQGVAYQSDGRAVVAGTRGGGSPDFAAIRIGADGKLDTMFAGDGFQTLTFGAEPVGGTERAEAVAVTPDDRIVLAGYTDATDHPFDFGIAVLNRDGFLDASFSGDGKRTVEFGASDQAFGVAVGGGHAYAAGSTGLSPERNIAVASVFLDATSSGDSGGSNTVPATQPPPAADRTAPVVSGLSLSPKAFKAAKGTKVRFKLSERARLRLVVQRVRHRRTRTTFARFARVTRTGAGGVNRLTLRRRVGSHRLTPGSYRLTIVATDAAGNRSKAVRARFRVLP